MKIVVHIDRILLDGISGKFDPRPFSAAIESELSQFLRATPLERWQSSAIEKVTAPVAPISATQHPEAIGHGIARVTGSVITGLQATKVEHGFENTTGEPA